MLALNNTPIIHKRATFKASLPAYNRAGSYNGHLKSLSQDTYQPSFQGSKPGIVIGFLIGIAGSLLAISQMDIVKTDNKSYLALKSDKPAIEYVESNKPTLSINPVRMATKNMTPGIVVFDYFPDKDKLNCNNCNQGLDYDNDGLKECHGNGVIGFIPDGIPVAKRIATANVNNIISEMKKLADANANVVVNMSLGTEIPLYALSDITGVDDITYFNIYEKSSEIMTGLREFVDYQKGLDKKSSEYKNNEEYLKQLDISTSSLESYLNLSNMIDTLAKANIPVVISAGNTGKVSINLLTLNPQAISVGGIGWVDSAENNLVDIFVKPVFKPAELPERFLLQLTSVQQMLKDDSSLTIDQIRKKVKIATRMGTSYAAPQIAGWVFAIKKCKPDITVERLNSFLRDVSEKKLDLNPVTVFEVFIKQAEKQLGINPKDLLNALYGQ